MPFTGGTICVISVFSLDPAAAAAAAGVSVLAGVFAGEGVGAAGVGVGVLMCCAVGSNSMEPHGDHDGRRKNVSTDSFKNSFCRNNIKQKIHTP